MHIPKPLCELGAFINIPQCTHKLFSGIHVAKFDEDPSITDVVGASIDNNPKVIVVIRPADVLEVLAGVTNWFRASRLRYSRAINPYFESFAFVVIDNLIVVTVKFTMHKFGVNLVHTNVLASRISLGVWRGLML